MQNSGDMASVALPLLRSSALPDYMAVSLHAAIREAKEAGVTPLEAAVVRAHEPDEIKRKALYSAMLLKSSSQQGVPAPADAASTSKASEFSVAPPAAKKAKIDALPSKETPAEEDHLRPGAYVKWCRKCKGAARASCEGAGHITVTLFSAMQKLTLDSRAKRTLRRLMDRELGYSTRLYAYVAPGRNSSYCDVEFVGGTLIITLATTELTYREALKMCDALDRCCLTSIGKKSKFVEADFDKNFPEKVLWKFPPRPKDEVLPVGAVLAKSDVLFSVEMRMYLKPVQPDEAEGYDLLVGYHNCTTPNERALDVQWHKKGSCGMKSCFQCGKGYPPKASLEDAALLNNEGMNGLIRSEFNDDSSEKFFSSEDETSDDEMADAQPSHCESSGDESSDEDTSDDEPMEDECSVS